ncbi:leucyl aminopeptidase family protein [Vineibacter terrae]|uniref:Leucyl aminopeptidase family protein n=2 Tax=Vineibacter terrae TaxID=2586908 RepID=A0A5C8PM27_9HYPH|nr:leucyl aminopeptidase family protein [Vineibacter terrae]
MWDYGALAGKLPAGDYCLVGDTAPVSTADACIAFALGSWRFTRYRGDVKSQPRLVWPAKCDRGAVERTVNGICLARDLITTPSNDMGPAELAAAARQLARRHRARFSVIAGNELLRRNYPVIHAVGRASTRAPRLVDIVWGRPSAPKVTLVGKGVCFDSGGLDLKPASGMLMMKKDMGGAATVLAAAAMVMAARLNVRLRVLIPAVENSVSGNAFRPLDVIKSRKGVTVEIGNTDAEGRLILCDALAEAAREEPALIIDVATLTGAARVALGPDVPALFSNDDELADSLLKAAKEREDPLWRLPLWRGYRRFLDSKVADINNAGQSPFGGAITAALFLQTFVPDSVPWAHIDTMAWNQTSQPGRPEGGEAMGARAIYGMLAAKYPPRR